MRGQKGALSCCRLPPAIWPLTATLPSLGGKRSTNPSNVHRLHGQLTAAVLGRQSASHKRMASTTILLGWESSRCREQGSTVIFDRKKGSFDQAVDCTLQHD